LFSTAAANSYRGEIGASIGEDKLLAVIALVELSIILRVSVE